MQRIGDLLSSLLHTPESFTVIEADELKARLRQCGRLLSAWPNARPANVDLTLLEYVNATRGVPVSQLGGLIEAAIQAGGEFMPPAGALMERVIKAKVTPRSYAYNAHITGEQSARETQERLLAEARRDARTIEPVMLEDVRRAVGIEAGSASRIGPGK